jgi:hypothetical protein
MEQSSRSSFLFLADPVFPQSLCTLDAITSVGRAKPGGYFPTFRVEFGRLPWKAECVGLADVIHD